MLRKLDSSGRKKELKRFASSFLMKMKGEVFFMKYDILANLDKIGGKI